MSVLTDVAVITSGEDEAVAWVHGRLADAEPDRPMHRLLKTGLEQAGAGGTKVTSLVVYAACFNHLDLGGFEEAVRSAPWRWPGSVVVYVDGEAGPTYVFSPARYSQWMPGARDQAAPAPERLMSRQPRRLTRDQRRGGKMGG